jgi:hypothetical protein
MNWKGFGSDGIIKVLAQHLPGGAVDNHEKPVRIACILSNRFLSRLGYSPLFTIIIITTDLVLLIGRWDSSLRGQQVSDDRERKPSNSIYQSY